MIRGRRRARAREVTLFDTSAGGSQPRRRRRGLLLATCLPAAIAGVAGALIAPSLGGSAPDFGPGSAVAADLARDAVRPGALPPLVPVVERDGHQRLATGAGEGGTPATRPAPPAWISIPAAGVEAPVDGLAAGPTGLGVPTLGRAGWWDGGPRPGEDGRAVIVGHLDSMTGPDVFAHVPTLAKGAPVVVRDRSGEYHRYSVVGVTRVPKAQFPTAAVYGPAARPVLVLITCGGPYDKALGHYRDNVLVYARGV